MKKKLIILYFLLGITTIGFGQEFPEKNKKYDLQIFEFLVSSTEKDSTLLETFLMNIKPFSKWDMRPLKREKVWALDTIHLASEVPNFIWGAFSNKYKISQKESMNMPNQFLGKGVEKRSSLESYLNENLKKIDGLSKLILESKNDIFLSQNNLQRIDNVYKENNRYWKYSIPSDSPFPISNQIETNIKDSYSKKQIKLLELLKDLKIYSAIKTHKGIFYIIDGFTDNSYGYYFNQQGEMEKDNFLFQIMRSEKINKNYFYYVAN
ncbi:hypothetical protein DMB65_17045 [Flavobacterium cheongpyeongense]|uniref:Uncharacterized protein n=1 Tax=Flavobacterium cheongpyeongense TaxID=2212651 RepID=A0A2V4BKJ6_9FLAO|nr:hypothetical protein [Flavobacterium cheongpyeongense]PXY39528.1 hypothetical protein DMB65_17045 [Flavobacterium cheongpyeongense]